MELELRFGDVPCTVELVRNGDRRRRVIEAHAGQELLRLDFSEEPGTITFGSAVVVGDPDWKVKRTPAAQMLAAFLQWAAGGEPDGRLDIEIGLRAGEVIDQAWHMYRSAQVPWLLAKLSCSDEVDADLRYALGEVLQSEHLLSATTIEELIERVHRRVSGEFGATLLRELSQAQDPAAAIRAIAA